MTIHQQNKGFIALISTIIIFIVLLAIATTLDLSAFYSRYNILDFETKQSLLAQTYGCLETHLADLIFQTYPPATNLQITTDKLTCEISHETKNMFSIDAQDGRYNVKIKVTTDESRQKILSMEEI